MARITKVNVECSYLKALPNYENVRLTAGVELELSENDNYKKVYNQAWDIVGNEIEKQLALFQETDTSALKKGLK
jgi:hypothetical protein